VFSTYMRLLLTVLLFQSAMSFEAAVQPGRQSSSSSSHSFGHIAAGHSHDSERRSHHKHRPTMSPSAAKKHPSGSPRVRGPLPLFAGTQICGGNVADEAGISAQVSDGERVMIQSRW